MTGTADGSSQSETGDFGNRWNGSWTLRRRPISSSCTLRRTPIHQLACWNWVYSPGPESSSSVVRTASGAKEMLKSPVPDLTYLCSIPSKKLQGTSRNSCDNTPKKNEATPKNGPQMLL